MTNVINVDMVVNSNVLGTKVYTLAMGNTEYDMDENTNIDTFREFVVANKGRGGYSGITEMTSRDTSLTYHSGKGNENFTGTILKSFADINSSDQNIQLDTQTYKNHLYNALQNGCNKTVWNISAFQVIRDGVFPSEFINSGWTRENLTVDGATRNFHTRVLGEITYHIWTDNERSTAANPNEWVYNLFSKYYDTANRAAYQGPTSSSNRVHAWHSNNSTWSTITVYIKLSVPINIEHYYFRTRGTDQYPKDFDIYVSSDGSTWTRIENRRNETTGYVNNMRKFDVENSYKGHFPWVKIIVYDNSNSWFSQSDFRIEGSQIV